MTTPVKLFHQRMHKYQQELFGHFDYRLRRLKIRTPQFFHCEWHRRARKTTAAVNLLIKEACRLPNSKFIYVSPTQVQTRNIVWDDPHMLRAYLPNKRELGYKLHEQKMLITFDTGSMIKFGGADEPDSLRGIDFIGGVLDEWAMCKVETLTEIFRPILAGALPPHLDNTDVFRWLLYLYTPKGVNHATIGFDNACCLSEGGVLPECGMAPKMAPNTFASRLDGELSGILPQSEIKRMQEEVARGELPQAFYDQEIRCSRMTAEEMTLITTEMLYDLNRHHETTTVSEMDVRKIVSIDPAWGGDVCEIMGLRNCEIKTGKSIKERHRIDAIVMASKWVAQQLGTKNFIVDVVNAPGIADLLSADEAGYYVQYFKSSHKATEKKDTRQAVTYANRRAESYAYTAEQISKKKVGPITDRELVRQLPIASQYKTQTSSGRLIILPKAIIKEDLGCSSDKADCYSMGVWGSQHVQPETDDDIMDFSHHAVHVPAGMI